MFDRKSVEEVIYKSNKMQSEGDVEEAAGFMADSFRRFPGEVDIAWHAVSTLKIARNYGDLSYVLNESRRYFPEHHAINLEWAKYPRLIGDLEGALERFRECAVLYPPNQGDGILFLTEQFILMRDLEKWDELVSFIDTNWKFFLDSNVWVIVPAIVFTLGACGLHEKICEFLNQFQKKISEESVVCGVNINNALIAPLNALANKAWMAKLAKPVKIVSVGQNCLPATVSARWGLSDDPLDFLPYDQSAFPKDSSSEALRADFSIFDDDSNFSARPFGGGIRVPFHSPTGVHFAHNPLPYESYEQSLSDTLGRFRRRIARFREVIKASEILYFVNFCGEGNPYYLIDSLRHRFGDDVNVFLLNTTREKMSFPHNDNVYYKHLPYPQDYGWNTISDYTSDRGVAFESHVIACLRHKISSMQ
ncbi:hypothetical protein J2D73_04785 [Acetobacter sacchari]|uniref:Tetratricopeptide repeat protein n=1 Tax=Acetobacter sacchari TaxID=2661687 RepID=A0ABS3LT81_9PROT|nr:hypothetical protein [Acetobacter sacchari]MBO1359112.1 hypothetical protein [Acetobacter sacchari]